MTEAELQSAGYVLFQAWCDEGQDKAQALWREIDSPMQAAELAQRLVNASTRHWSRMGLVLTNAGLQRK